MVPNWIVNLCKVLPFASAPRLQSLAVAMLMAVMIYVTGFTQSWWAKVFGAPFFVLGVYALVALYLKIISANQVPVRDVIITHTLVAGFSVGCAALSAAVFVKLLTSNPSFSWWDAVMYIAHILIMAVVGFHAGLNLKRFLPIFQGWDDTRPVRLKPENPTPSPTT